MLPGMKLSQAAETVSGSRSRKKWKSDPFCVGASPERLHVQKKSLLVLLFAIQMLTEICWPDKAPRGPADWGASVLPPCGDRFLSKTLCQNRTDISGALPFCDEEYSHQIGGKSSLDGWVRFSWQFQVPRNYSSRRNQALFPAGHLLSREGWNYQWLLWWFRKYWSLGRELFARAIKGHLWRPCLWGLCIFCLIFPQRTWKGKLL